MKTETKQSVVKDWVSELPFTQQALLMLALRGADGVSKYSPSKHIVHYMRDVVLHAAYENYDGKPEGFMRADYDNFEIVAKGFFLDVDMYPLHFYMHLVHASEVIGYNHPDSKIAAYWLAFYLRACHNLHVNPEVRSQLNQRLAK